MKEEPESKTRIVTIMLTRKCQLNCTYCGISQSRPDISEKDLYRAIDLAKTIDEKEIEIQFFGGEPMLRIDLIRKAVVYARKGSGPRIRFSVTTNGILLKDSTLDFLKENNFTVMLSIDGKKKTHCLNRGGEEHYERVVRNARKLAQSGIDNFANMVIGPDNIEEMKENAEFIKSLGMKEVMVAYMLGVKWKEKDIIRYSKMMREMSWTRNARILEPVMSSPVFMVDTDGKLYRGCSVVLEKQFPGLQDLFSLGHVSGIMDLEPLRITYRDQYERMIGNDYPLNEKDIIINNFTVGINSAKALGSNYIRYADCIDLDKARRIIKETSNANSSSNSLSLMLTYRCPMDCSYCGVKKVNSDMSEAVLKRAISSLSGETRPLIKFFGGEPLLRFDLIKKAVEHSRSLGIDADFQIVTSGIGLTREIARYIAENSIKVMLSIDGDQEGNGKRRLASGKPSLMGVSQSIKRLVESESDFFINMVVSPDNAKELIRNIKYLLGLGAKRIQIGYRIGVFWNREKRRILEAELKKTVSAYPNNVLMNISNFCEPVMISQEPIVDVDGNVYYDAAIFAERFFPELRKSHFIGKVGDHGSLREIERNKEDMLNLFFQSLEGNPLKEAILLNNVGMGFMFSNIFDRGSAPLEENPIFDKIMFSSFQAQETFKKASGIPLKSVFLYIESNCDNDCIFCKKKELADSNLGDLERKLKQNRILKGERISLVGNDVLCHADIVEVIQMCRRHGFKHIEVMTSGNRLADQDLVRKLAGIGANIVFSIPLYSSSPESHDMITGSNGSFKNVMDGIRNVRKSENLDVVIHTLLLKQNLDEMNELEYFVKRILRLKFTILPVRPKDSNTLFEEIAPSYIDMIRKLKVSSLMGFPLCVASRIQENILPDGRQSTDGMKLYLLDQLFAKPSSCSGCSKSGSCAGTFREYVKLHGTSDLLPFQGSVRSENIARELKTQGVGSPDILESDRIGEIYIMLSLGCKLRCRVCPWWGDNGICKDDDFMKKYRGELDYSKAFERFISDLSGFKPSIINLSGGEPLETKGWYKVAKQAKSLGMKVYLTTSGMEISENIDKILEVIDQVDVSISGPKNILNTLRKGPDGHFDKVISGMRELSEKRKGGVPRIQVSCVVSDLNYMHLNELAEYLKKQGIDVDMHYFPSVIYMDKDLIQEHRKTFKEEFGSEARSWTGYSHKPASMDFTRLSQEFGMLKGYKNVKIGPVSSEDEIKRYFSDGKWLASRFSDICIAPWTQPTLMPNGDIWVCHDLPVGNIKKDRFRDIWNGKTIKKLRKRILDKGLFPGCRGCYYIYYSREKDKGMYSREKDKGMLK